ncbi:hypothetical protein [Gallaecimonas xiamenensis]|uniref:hypothetical protein n=1 Tax=Gallaecimonas xiamenensis TaxID=1207039 RepID=UPI0012E9A9B7|nr:hypothetical protein [Gallaecimonas xiamenensis]
MIPDPNTKEGMDEIQRRIKRRREETTEARKRAEDEPDDEVSGKLTNPSELDLVRDRKKNDE